jgi:hypothetical protein
VGAEVKRWIRISFVLLVGLGLVLGPGTFDVLAAAESPMGQYHDGAEADCADIHASHGGHHNHCCIASAVGAAIAPGAIVNFFPRAAADSIFGRDEAGIAGPPYGIFKPPRDA